jgi:menaquinone-dependent protoporphyrinogen oxidase
MSQKNRPLSARPARIDTDVPRLLIAYSSSFGSTGGIAAAIADALRDGRLTVDVLPISDTLDPAGYDFYIIGSAIQYDNWMHAARAFVIRHQEVLAARPAAYFFSCMTLSVPSRRAEAQASAYARKLTGLAPAIRPVSIGRFAGALDFAAMPVLARLPARIIFAFLGVKSGDYRDWHAIQAWAHHLKGTLLSGHA